MIPIAMNSIPASQALSFSCFLKSIEVIQSKFVAALAMRFQAIFWPSVLRSNFSIVPFVARYSMAFSTCALAAFRRDSCVLFIKQVPFFAMCFHFLRRMVVFGFFFQFLVTLRKPIVTAFFTPSKFPLSLCGKVVSGKGVPSFAMRSTSAWQAILEKTTQKIFSVRYRFQMIRIYALRVSAQVVQNTFSRYRAACNLVGKTMRGKDFALKTKRTVRASFFLRSSTEPQPTIKSCSFSNPFPKRIYSIPSAQCIPLLNDMCILSMGETVK